MVLDVYFVSFERLKVFDFHFDHNCICLIFPLDLIAFLRSHSVRRTNSGVTKLLNIFRVRLCKGIPKMLADRKTVEDWPYLLTSGQNPGIS